MVCNSYLPRSPRSAIGKFGKVPDFSGIRRRSKRAAPIAFGGQILEENDRDEQRKLVKYNHLVANCLIFHNVCVLTQRLHEMRKEGVTVDAETLSRLSPYITQHVNRYGEYRIDLNRQAPPINYQLPILMY